MFVSPKKQLGQHFLKDENIAKKIADSLVGTHAYQQVIEVGPGTGVLTKYLLADKRFTTHVVEIDKESIAFLNKHYPHLSDRIMDKDFLKFTPDWIHTETLETSFAVIGNFPYNISSQILFKILEYRNQIPEAVGMFQKEVAERVAAKEGSKTYGILSVLLQAFYKIDYLFTVHENVFNPPPKVKSAVIRLTRNNTRSLHCNEELFFKVVKAGFNQRRKTLRNALSAQFDIKNKAYHTNPVFNQRAEQLSVNDFILLTQLLSD
jgi:16S rRNA (adenine1518-N6/adenine1519-N6)-dimethyltransferase